MNSSSAFGNVLIAAPVQHAVNNVPHRVAPKDSDTRDFQRTIDDVRAEQEVKTKAKLAEKISSASKRSHAVDHKDAAKKMDNTDKSIPSNDAPQSAEKVKESCSVKTESDNDGDEEQKQNEEEVTLSDSNILVAGEAPAPVLATVDLVISSVGIANEGEVGTTDLVNASSGGNLDIKSFSTQPSALPNTLIDTDMLNENISESLSVEGNATLTANILNEGISALSGAAIKNVSSDQHINAAALAVMSPVTSTIQPKLLAPEISVVNQANSLEGAELPASEAIFGKLLQEMTSTKAGTTDAGEQSSDNGSHNSAVTANNTSATLATTLDSLSRSLEPQAPAGRSFVVQTSVPVTVGQPQWSQAVGEKVLWLAAQNVTAAEIRLDPPELGPMQVKVSLNQEQASVSFTSHNASVRELLDQNANRLRDMFTAQGLNLVNVDVSDKSFQRQQGEAKQHAGQGDKVDMVEEATAVSVSAIMQQRLVDHYA